MGAKAGTNIVTRGLRFVVDYANSKCRNPLTGTPETCKNLVNFNGPGGMGINESSGGGIQTTATAGKFLDGTTFNGQKVMVGNDNPGGTGVAGDGLHFNEDITGTGTAGTEITYQFWTYKTTSGNQYFFDARGGGGIWCFANYSSDNISIGVGGAGYVKYDFSNPYSASDSKFINKWINIAITGKTSEDGLIYINGEEVSVNTQGLLTTYVAQQALPSHYTGVGFRIGHRLNNSYVGSHIGYFGPWLIYNKKLTDAEVLQNYNAYKKRFV